MKGFTHNRELSDSVFSDLLFLDLERGFCGRLLGTPLDGSEPQGMRILHTADWHLGKSVFGVSMLEDQAYLLDQILNLIRDLKPQYLVLAGDLFDRPNPPPEAVQLWEQTLSRSIIDLGCKIIWVRGQHDYPERLALNSQLLRDSGLHIISGHRQALSPMEVSGPTGPVRFWFLPYLETRPMRRFLNQPELRDPLQASEGFLRHMLSEMTFTGMNCLFGYTWFEGVEISESKRRYSLPESKPLSPDLLEGFDYVGLGFSHHPCTLNHKRQRYSGSLMRYSEHEIGQQKSLVMIDLEGPGQVSVETFPLSPRHELRRFEGTVETLLGGAQTGGRQDYVVLRFTDREPDVRELRELQEVYPNLVHLETPEPELEQFEELDLGRLFTHFHDLVSDKPLEPEHHDFLAEMLE